MKSKVTVTNIEWDTDGEDCDLPTSTELEIEHDEEDDLDAIIADALSDKFGFCMFDFNYDVRK